MSQIILTAVAAAEGLALLVCLFYLMVRVDQELAKEQQAREQVASRRRRRASDEQQTE